MFDNYVELKKAKKKKKFVRAVLAWQAVWLKSSMTLKWPCGDSGQSCPGPVCSSSHALCLCSCLWLKHLNQTNPFKDIPGRKGLDSPTQSEVQATCLTANNNGVFHTLHLETNRDRPGQWEGPQSTAASNKEQRTQGEEDVRREGHKDMRRADSGSCGHVVMGRLTVQSQLLPVHTVVVSMGMTINCQCHVNAGQP